MHKLVKQMHANIKWLQEIISIEKEYGLQRQNSEIPPNNVLPYKPLFLLPHFTSSIRTFFNFLLDSS